MSSQNQSPPQSQSNPGYAALSIMGWAELAVSLILFLLEVYPTAMLFALASIVLGFTANQIRFRHADYRGHLRGQPAVVPPVDDATRRRNRVIHAALLILGAAALGLSVLYIMRREGMQAFLMAQWAVALAILAARFRFPAAAKAG
ncbi:MAG: hypothetical protein Kow00124_32590 [Anaerolineae bacterium]